MSVRAVTTPDLYPVSLAEFSAHLRQDSADEDPMLATYLASAVAVVAKTAGVVLMAQTWRASFDSWAQACEGGTIVRVPRGPLLSVVSIKVFDDADVETIIDAANYYVDAAGGRIVPRTGFTWTAPTRVANGVEIDFIAGHLAPGDVPENLRSAILLQAGAFYKTRETADELAPGVLSLINLDRTWLA